MSSTIQLTFDPTAVGTLNSEKVMVAVPLLYVFMILRLMKGTKENSERLNDLGRRLFMYGVASLFSINFLQSSIIGAVLAWAVLICIIITHCFVFLKQTGQKYHNVSLLIYYGLLMVWFVCIVFYYIYDGLS